MLRTTLLATTALVVGASFAMAGGKAPPKGIHQPTLKNIVATVKHNGVANQGLLNKFVKGAHVVNKTPVFTPSATFNNLSRDANAQFVSWYGFYAENSCYSYYYSSHDFGHYCYTENSALPITGAGVAVKKIIVPIYGSSAATYNAGIYSDSSGLPGGLIAGGSAPGTSTSYCCSALQTVGIHKTMLNSGTQYWVEVTANTSYGLWETEDTDYASGQPYDWHYGETGTDNGTYTYSYSSGWIASTASPYRPAAEVK